MFDIKLFVFGVVFLLMGALLANFMLYALSVLSSDLARISFLGILRVSGTWLVLLSFLLNFTLLSIFILMITKYYERKNALSSFSFGFGKTPRVFGIAFVFVLIGFTLFLLEGLAIYLLRFLPFLTILLIVLFAFIDLYILLHFSFVLPLVAVKELPLKNLFEESYNFVKKRFLEFFVYIVVGGIIVSLISSYGYILLNGTTIQLIIGAILSVIGYVGSVALIPSYFFEKYL